MGLFDSLYPTKQTKKNATKPLASMVCAKARDKKIDVQENRKYLEETAIETLLKANDKRKKKFLPDILRLWALLDTEKYIESYYEQTLNPYIEKNPSLKDDPTLYNTLSEKYMNILDIKLLNKFKIENVQFKNVFLVTYEIYDKSIEFFRPYVEIYTKQENTDDFRKIGYGYDKNDDSAVELYIDTLNYAIFLHPKGYISFPTKRKKLSLHVEDIISSTQIDTILENTYIEDIDL